MPKARLRWADFNTCMKRNLNLLNAFHPTIHHSQFLIHYSPFSILRLLAPLLVMVACSSAPKPPFRYYPYENLLTLMADCQRFLRADVYRYPYPKDLSGQNVYKSALVRLANYERLYPGRFPDVLAFMHARLYERLGDYAQAVHYYRITASMDSELAPLAEERLCFAESFQTICGFIPYATGIDEYICEYEKKLEALDTLIEKCSGFDVEPLARIEKEKAEVDFAVFLQDNRHLLAGGTKRAIDEWKKIITEHAQSKNIQSHRLHLADFYFTLAKEYATWKPPERIGFDWSIFESYAILARDIYYHVGNEDGYPEKLEARGKLEAILSYIETIRQRSR